MRQAQLIAYGIDDDHGERLQALVSVRGVGVRVVRQPKACVNLLRHAVGVLLLRVGRDLEAEFGLLAQAARHFPRVAPVVWGDVDHPRLAGLAWDLGARGVVLAGGSEQSLHDLILGLLPG